MMGALIAAVVLGQSMSAELSFYGPQFEGRKMANGMRFSHSGSWGAVVRAAGSKRPRLPFGTMVKFTYQGRSATMRVGDTGSYRPKGGGWWFDLPTSIFRQLAPLKRGRLRGVSVEVLDSGDGAGMAGH